MTSDEQKPAVTEEEIKDWLDSLGDLVSRLGAEAAQTLLMRVREEALNLGIRLPGLLGSRYINTIPKNEEPPYPGDGELEWRIRSLTRWNAMAMVVRANRVENGIGGHISSYASSATLYDVAFNHFFRGHGSPDRDLIYFQGHAAPGIYARAFLEGRISKEKLENFRRELKPGGGLSSYPHPWLMPDFWEFPTVSMGLGPIMAIYQARFNRYLEARGLISKSDSKVWAFLGDGETDEPETLGAITLAARENLDNLIFVINCNLQRLDGPVRGNGKIIQELGTAFAGAGWNVLKVVWGADWDPLLARDHNHLLKNRMEEVVDGQYQKYSVETGAYTRDHFFGGSPELLDMVKDLSDEQIKRLRRGGHDPIKIYAAYKAAVEHKGQPTVILAKTIKGYGLGESGEGKNITHQQKKLNEDELRAFRSRYGIPISDDAIASAPFYKPAEDNPEMTYLKQRRESLGGAVPARRAQAPSLPPPPQAFFEEFEKGTDGREVSTTMVFVRILAKLLRDENLAKHVVPIVSDEARTFGMESLFRQCGIYSCKGQLYEPVDKESLLYYRESVDGQILEEGITEAGAFSSYIAAGTAHATHGVPMIPFFIFYSMFGLQRVGDLVWAAGDMQCRGFILGATAGRTSLAGEGLQHQDGNSHLFAFPYPTLAAYDPAFAYELAIIMQDGLHRMYEKQEPLSYYLTLGNENYAMPPMPEGCREGVLKGIYRYKAASLNDKPVEAKLLGSGAILNEVLAAQKILEEDFKVSTEVYSVTSYKNLYLEACDVERQNLLHPENLKDPYITRQLSGGSAVTIAASDYVKALPLTVARFIPGPFTALGTDGFGRSESREALRDFFEVDAVHIVAATLSLLAREGKMDQAKTALAIRKLGIDTERENPARR